MGAAEDQKLRVPADWGLPNWGPEQFKAFNDARRHLHQVMQRGEELDLEPVIFIPRLFISTPRNPANGEVDREAAQSSGLQRST